MMNSSLIDQPNLLTECSLKRMRDDDKEEESSSSKGMKLSDSSEDNLSGDSAKCPVMTL